MQYSTLRSLNSAPFKGFFLLRFLLPPVGEEPYSPLQVEFRELKHKGKPKETMGKPKKTKGQPKKAKGKPRETHWKVKTKSNT